MIALLPRSSSCNDVNAANQLGETALHGAAFRGVNEVAQYLADQGARLDARDTRGWTPLVDDLLDTGHVRAHRLGLGLDLHPSGRVIDRDGHVVRNVFAVGSARRGLDWEVTAVPDLRTQALEVAGEILPPIEQRAPRSGTA